MAEVKLKGVLLVERTVIEEKMTLLQYDPYDPEKIVLMSRLFWNITEVRVTHV